jgi:SAM-dependent methyltransferase
MAEDQHRHDPAPAPEEADVYDAAFWDARYASAPAIWSGQPNPQLMAEAADLVASRALDVGCGEGADAVWLAGRGWRVTAVDLSYVALERAADHARSMGPDVAGRITWRQADMTEEIAFDELFGLVSVQFMHLPQPARDALYRRLADLVAPGGTLLVVGHHPSDLDTAAHVRPHRGDLLFRPEEIVALLDPSSWTVVAAESRPRTMIDGDGRTLQVADAVLVARRIDEHRIESC